MIDDTIIGLTDTRELRYLEKLALALPENSVMVEVGTFLGRTAFVLAATRPDCHLAVVDPFDADVPAWLASGNIRGDRSRYVGCDQLKTFAQMMAPCENYIALVVRSPLPGRFPAEPASLVFIDAAHNYDAIKADLDYWSRYVVSNTALCGHDFCDEFSDVKRAVNEFAAVHGLRVHVEPDTTIWKFENAA